MCPHLRGPLDVSHLPDDVAHVGEGDDAGARGDELRQVLEGGGAACSGGGQPVGVNGEQGGRAGASGCVRS